MKLSTLMNEVTTEYSAGAIVYRIENGIPLFLVLLNKKIGWGFPKGHLDGNESAVQAARREIFEECGIRVKSFHPKFKEVISYPLKWDFTNNKPYDEPRKKFVTFFLAESPTANVKISSEHDGFKWVTLEQTKSLNLFNKSLLKKAYATITN